MVGVFIRYRYLVCGLILVFALIATYSFIRNAIYKEGYAACEAKHELELKKGREKREHKEKEIIRLPVDALHRRYCEWVRDDKQKCLQADIPISGG